MAAELKDQGTVTKGYADSVMVLICVYVSGFGLSWGPLGWLVPSQIFPMEIRSDAQSITAALFFFFGSWVFAMTCFVYYFLPETKNIPFEKMELIWREHWYLGRIVSHDEIYL
ncbi:Hexose carrier protein HEX6-like protein [Drosera capensis]